MNRDILDEDLFEYDTPLGGGLRIYKAAGIKEVQILPKGKYFMITFDNGYFITGFIKEELYSLNKKPIRYIKIWNEELGIEEEKRIEDIDYKTLSIIDENNRFSVEYAPTQDIRHDRLTVKFAGEVFLDIVWRKTLTKKECL